MTPRTRLLLYAYFAFWALVLVGAARAATALGYRWWHGAMAGYLLFFLVNGTLAHVYRSRRLRAEGKTPQRYLDFLFFGSRGFKVALHEDAGVPWPLRALLGLCFIAVGGALLLFVLWFASQLVRDGFSDAGAPALGYLGYLLFLGIPLALGSIVSYIGFRLVVAKGDEPLIPRRGA